MMHEWEEAAEELKRYMRMLTLAVKPLPKRRHGCPNRFMLEFGSTFKPEPLPDNIKPGTIKYCYQNATDLMISHKLIYCEGYALGIIPVQHAWCCTPDGKVIDPTWVGDRLGMGYFGIPFDRDYVMNKIIRTERYSIIENWNEKWPFLDDDPYEFLSEDFGA
jgi:hypothetical protein